MIRDNKIEENVIHIQYAKMHENTVVIATKMHARRWRRDRDLSMTRVG